MITRVLLLIAFTLLIMASCGGEVAPPAKPASKPAPSASSSSARAPKLDRPTAYVEVAPCPPPSVAPPTKMQRARQVLQTRHVEGVTTMSISKEDMLVTTSQSETKVWNLRDRGLLHRTIHEEANNASFTADGKSVVLHTIKEGVIEIDLDTTAKQPRNVNQWIQRGSGSATAGDYKLERPADPKLYLGTLHLAPNDTHAIATAGTKHVAIWTLAGGSSSSSSKQPEVVEILPATSNERVGAVDLGVRGEQFLVALAGSKSARVLLFTKANSTWTSRDLAQTPSSTAADVRTSPDGSEAAVVTSEGLSIVDLPNGTPRWKKPTDRRIGSGSNWVVGMDWSHVAFSPVSNTLVAARANGSLVAFDSKTGQLQYELGSEVRPAKNAFFTSPTELAVASDDHLVFWSTTEGRVTRVERIREGSSEDVEAMFINGDIVTDSVDEFGCGPDQEKHSFQRWVGTKAPPPQRDDDEDDEAVDGDPMKPRPKKKKPASFSWPPVRGASSICTPRKPLAMSIEKGVALVMDVADVAGSKQQGAYVVDLKTKKRISQLADYHLLRTNKLQFTADAAHVIGIRGLGANGSLILWDARTGKALERNIQLTHPTRSAEKGVDSLTTLSPDGKRIALSFHQQISLRSFPDLKEIKNIQAPGGEPLNSAVALDAAGSAWIFGWSDGVFQRWDSTSGMAAKPASATGIEKLALDANKSTAAAVTTDGAVALWDVGTSRLKATFASFEDDEFIAFTPGGAYDGTTEVSDRIGWVFSNTPPMPMEGFRFEQFEKRFRAPDILKARLSGGTDDAGHLDARPPHVTFARAPAAHADDVMEVMVKASSLERRVEAVRAYIEGRPVAAKSVCEAEGLVTLRLPLMSGVNRVSVYAFDDHGYASNPATFDVVSKSAAKPNLFIVSAGVSKYPKLKPEYQLDVADADAKSIANAFGAQQQQQQLKMFGTVTQRLLLNEQVTPASVDEALATLSAMKPDDVGVVFLAGHGVRPTKDGEMVFLTSSADAQLKEGTIGWTQIGKRLAAAKGRVLVLLDACHSGAVTEQQMMPNAALATDLIQSQRAGALVFAAAKGRQLSYETNTSSKSRSLVLDTTRRPLVSPKVVNGPKDSKDAHGYFTGAILRALETQSTDRNNDGAIQVSELLDDVIARVTSASDGKQTPWVARRDLFGDFTIAKPTTQQ